MIFNHDYWMWEVSPTQTLYCGYWLLTNYMQSLACVNSAISFRASAHVYVLLLFYNFVLCSFN